MSIQVALDDAGSTSVAQALRTRVASDGLGRLEEGDWTALGSEEVDSGADI